MKKIYGVDENGNPGVVIVYYGNNGPKMEEMFIANTWAAVEFGSNSQITSAMAFRRYQRAFRRN